MLVRYLTCPLKAEWTIRVLHLIRVKGLAAQPCPTLCNPMDGSPPGSSVEGILQARILEWVVIPFSRGSSRPRDQPRFPALQADSLPPSHLGNTNYQSSSFRIYIYFFSLSQIHTHTHNHLLGNRDLGTFYEQLIYKLKFTQNENSAIAPVEFFLSFFFFFFFAPVEFYLFLDVRLG